MDDRLQMKLESLLGELHLMGCRIELESLPPGTSLAELRGLWGSALKSLDEEAYARVFSGDAGGAPAYAFGGPRMDATSGRLELDWLAWGPSRNYEALLLAAWEVAAQRGVGPIGPDGRRHPFRVVRIRNFDPWAGSSDSESAGHEASARASASRPCRLTFPSMLRLNRKGMIVQPTWPDLALGALRRLEACVKSSEAVTSPGTSATSAADAPDGRADGSAWNDLRRETLQVARETPASRWQGEPAGFRRYSGSQEQVIEIWGVRGYLELSAGAGELAPLVEVMRVLGIGKATVFGQGRAEVEFTVRPATTTVQFGADPISTASS